MKRGFATILVLLVVVLVGGVGVGWYLSNTGVIPKFTGPATTEQPPAPPEVPEEGITADWDTYTNTEYGYSLKHPGLVISGGAGDWYSDQYFYESTAVAEQTHAPRITVRVIKSVGPQWKDVREYFEELYNKTKEINRLEIDGLSAFSGETTPKSGTKPYYDSYVVVFKNDKVYKIGSSAIDRGIVDSRNLIYNGILSTFKFTE